MLQILRCVGRDEYATSASIGEGGDNDMHRPFFFFLTSCCTATETHWLCNLQDVPCAQIAMVALLGLTKQKEIKEGGGGQNAVYFSLSVHCESVHCQSVHTACS